MYPQLGAGVSWAGGVSAVISVGTIVSSLASDWLNNKLGTGRVTALSVATTAVALFGFRPARSSGSFACGLCRMAWAPAVVDAALNNYVALHYESRHMSWLLHVGHRPAAERPVIMGWALAGSTWQNGLAGVRSAVCADGVAAVQPAAVADPRRRRSGGGVYPGTPHDFRTAESFRCAGGNALFAFASEVVGGSPVCGPPVTAP